MRRFLEQKSSSADVRRLMETDEGYDPAVWQQMAEQLGLQGLALPEEYGGSGYGFVEQVVVLEEMGRALLCAPYFSTVVLAAHGAAGESGDEAAQKDLLPGIADGSTIATLAVGRERRQLGHRAAMHDAGAALAATATRSTARKTLVLDGHIADLSLVVAQADGGPSLFAVDGATRPG